MAQVNEGPGVIPAKSKKDDVIATQAATIEGMKAELARLKGGKGTPVTEGTVVPDATTPANFKREAFGRRAIKFDEIDNYNWRITAKRIQVTGKEYSEKAGRSISYNYERTPAAMFTVTVRRIERDEVGNLAPREIGGVFPFPFFTFDNVFTARGISPKDVAFAIWQQRESWGKTFQVDTLTDEEVQTYFFDRMSPEQLEARSQMADPRRIAELAGLNDQLLGQPETPLS